MNAHRQILTEASYVSQMQFFNFAIQQGEESHAEVQLKLRAGEIDQSQADMIAGALASVKKQREDLESAWSAQVKQNEANAVTDISVAQAASAALAKADIDEAGEHFLKLMEHIAAIKPIVDARNAAIDRAVEHLSDHRSAFADDPSRGREAYAHFCQTVRSTRQEVPLIQSALYAAGLGDMGVIKSDAKFAGGGQDATSFVERWRSSLVVHFQRLFGDD
ncbi:hypothetical protein H9L12_08340 [Sphingomonas rhizophila]|uniref:Uncharacterized protein n=1 Tax=Sphingomonas rhizophila TaxID=2071607 RepID=A0A7G9S915_9SPHN|nr:hypothetical protein [Sphingomonas rhizophila]QNN64340.1 hypothetical protein H9L12_08340 [Sphingomonas rhizophila]